MRRGVTAVAATALASILVLLGCTGARPKPNVVLVVVDSLGADALACYGGAPGVSANIDRLATEGVRFERAVAQASWNVPSVSSLLTSAHPWKHGQGLDEKADVATLAEVLGKNGYHTAAFAELAPWPLLAHGFATFENTAAPHLHGDPESNSATKTVTAALEWMRKQGDEPFFVVIHTYEAHSYFLGKPAHRAFAEHEHSGYRGPLRAWAVRDTNAPAGEQVIKALLSAAPEDIAYARSLYRGAVAQVDAEIGRLVSELHQAGLEDKTVLVVTSSNGEGFRPDLKRVHHGGRLHHDVLHVPLIVRAPGLPPGVSKSLVELVDVAPTLLDLAGLPAEPRFSGRVLTAAETGFMTRFRAARFTLRPLEAKPALAEEATFRIGPGGQRERARGRQLALYSDEGAAFIDGGEAAELYDLASDPQQEKNEAATPKYANVVESLRGELKKRLGGAGAAAGEPDPANVEQLRSLGYVQ